MPPTRPLLALLAAISLLFTLTAPDAGAHKRGKKHQRHHAAKKQCKKKHKNKPKKIKRCMKRKRNRHRDHGGTHTGPGGTQNGPTGVGAPGATEDPYEATTAIGTITAVDGDLVTVTLSEGGVVTARVTEDTDVICADAADEEDTGGEEEFEDAPDEDETSEDEISEDDDGGEARQAVLCTPAVGQPVYDLEVDDTADLPTFLWLDLAG